ncbi:MAG: tRNA uridine-5-carboxymethylaminomethyl(34) synthesis GTPase MnmE [Oscillospiraceae bacterium]|nr:tRNA uridine-5-carboxymethylaminomethyl(34) synthesis GTPase MnmE [Oscillospiraceae bacterium]
MTTIAAISTPNTIGSVAMIRISGDDAFVIAGKVFKSEQIPVAEMRGYTAAYGNIYDDDVKIDDGVLLIFRAPKSYTGENVAEITCHGGVFVARRVLKACINAGATFAEAGEFTKRAVLNGKMTLTQAESVIDVINSVSEQYLTCANSQKSGSLYRKINQIAEQILSVSSHISAWLDYPEEGLDSFEESSHIGQLTDCRLRLELLLKSYDIAAVMREGIVTAIVGKPNVGKSTLMNLLIGKKKSIVTNIPGTTRDIVESSLNIDGVVLRLCDCAGIRETSDTVEKIGIELMQKQIEESSLIIAVFDNSRPLEKEDYDLIELIRGKKSICVINKSDLQSSYDFAVLPTEFNRIVRMSAKNGSEAERQKLSDVIVSTCEIHSLDLSAGFIANERQRGCVIKAEEYLSQAITLIESGNSPLDATGFMLENALDALYQLSGKSTSNEIIAEVFKNFCVGK